MSNELKMLIEQTRGHKMTPAEREEQRISFAYGNVAIENPAVTRESVREVSAQMDHHRERRRETGSR